jgi:hypothetical protein
MIISNCQHQVLRYFVRALYGLEALLERNLYLLYELEKTRGRTNPQCSTEITMRLDSPTQFHLDRAFIAYTVRMNLRHLAPESSFSN